MSGDDESKTETPSEQKLNEAREEGNIPYSKELSNAMSIFAILLVIWIFGSIISNDILSIFTDVFANKRNWPLDNASDIANVLGYVFWQTFLSIFPPMVCLMVFGVLSTVLQNPPTFVLKRISFKISNISPFSGFKRLFGKKTLQEFAKSVAKIAGVGALTGLVIYGASADMFILIAVPPETMLNFLQILVIQTVGVVLLAASFIGLADLLWTRHGWFTELMMSKQEIKEEMKQSEGDPMVKMRARSLARDRSRRRMIADVANASLVIANPTHFAVAIAYNHNVDRAPKIVAKGQELIALRIRAKADDAGVPIFEDPPLARALYRSVQVNQELPAEFYIPVAAMIRAIMDVEKTGIRK